MTPRPKRRWAIGAISAVGLLLVTAVAPSRWTGCGPLDLLASYVGGHLQSVPDEQVARELQQIAELDQVGLLVLIDALGSDRARVADAAGATLDHQLAGWRVAERTSEPIRGLSRTPVGAARRSVANAVRNAASDLALKILDWPVDGRHVNRAALIADCEHVLRIQGTDIREAWKPAGSRSPRSAGDGAVGIAR